MNWIKIKNEKPNIKKLGDGNFCEVAIKTELGLEGIANYGNSGFMNEPNGFWQPIKTKCGLVKTQDKIIEWAEI